MEHMRIISIEVKVNSMKTVYVQQCTAKLFVALVDYMPDDKLNDPYKINRILGNAMNEIDQIIDRKGTEE